MTDETLTILENTICKDIVTRIENNTLALPRLPKIVIEIDRVINDDTKSIPEVVEVLKFDAAISARIIQVANSPMLRGRTEISTLRSAVTRIGVNVIRNLVLSMTMIDDFNSDNKFLQCMLEEEWRHCVYVMSYSLVLADTQRHLKSEVALTAGLVHDIGVLPIIKYFSQNPELLENPQVLKDVIHSLHTEIGIMVMEEWHFPKEFTYVLQHHENAYNIEPKSVADYCDIVAVANLFDKSTADDVDVKWHKVQSLKNLGLTVDELSMLSEADDAVKELQHLLS